MEIDIYAILEVKIDSIWQNYQEIEIERDYELFSKMGLKGRGNQKPISELRGFPKDCNPLVKLLINKISENSISFFNHSEMKELIQWYRNIHQKDTFDLYEENYWPEQYESCVYFLEKNAKDFRLIFGFDD